MAGDKDEELQGVQRRAEMEGQRFRWQIMARLFNSKSSGAVRRPD